MKNKKGIIITCIIIIIVIIIGLITYNILNDNNKLTSSEKKWINDNIKTVQNINVLNDVNIFGNTGSGVFYEFINDLELETKLDINPVTFNMNENPQGLTLNSKTILNDNDQIFYTDHYVLVGTKDEIIANYTNLIDRKIGVLKSDLSYISSFLNNESELTLVSFDNKEKLLSGINTEKEVDYLIVPLTVYLDAILENDLYIVKHLSDIKYYYTISGNDSKLTNIVKKFYNNWASENLDAYFKREEFSLFTNELNITETEVDSMQSVVYNYGFINNSPYEVIMSGNYGGIIAMYLSDFKEFSNIDINFTKYRNLDRFKKAINNKEIDLYFNYYNLQDDYKKINSKIIVSYSIIANKSNNIVINSLNSLANQTVYVEEDSVISNYLASINNINIKTYKNDKELKKLNKKDVIIVLDKNIFNLYSGSNLSNYTERYTNIFNNTYNFKSKNESAFYKLFNKYVMSLDTDEMIYEGMYNHNLTVKAGSILGNIAKYILLTLAAFAIIFIIFYKSSKRIKIAKKIRKENKMKFIDQLTSLKNRNYLNEYINNWNNNTVYPQTMIVIDLNNIQFINDTLGYEEGDKQIKAAANVLIKTQLDNSDIMRTDGNEFLIYLVGYTQKQVTNYIHKLNKEFKKLPYEYGAEFGYSIINDSIKTVEDAIIEATEEMKNQKKKVDEEDA